MTVSGKLQEAAKALSKDVDCLRFSSPVEYVYNPLQYAWEAHREYLEKFADSPKRVVFLGMNPGPWGMAQTGVPFGEIVAVREWMGIECAVDKPDPEHPKRPVEGFACGRSEVSGRRLWGFVAGRFGSPERFFAEHFVGNYCPLVFMEQSGRNRTPDKLPAEEKAALDAVCDAHLASLLEILSPQWAVGVGAFAESKLQAVAGNLSSPPRVTRILHPSPASPAANRGWDKAALRQLQEAGVWKAG